MAANLVTQGEAGVKVVYLACFCTPVVSAVEATELSSKKAAETEVLMQSVGTPSAISGTQSEKRRIGFTFLFYFWYFRGLLLSGRERVGLFLVALQR